MTPQQAHNHLPRPAHKEPPAHAPNAALMIDFDNVTMAIRSDLQTELKRLLQSEIIRGKVAVQRAYADWRRYPQYIVPLSESSIDLIFAPAHGANKKNATDIRLAIDALELVFTRPEIGTFILLSGDSDFSSLVLKLKEYGKYVIGVGIRESSSDLLIQNCDEYYSYNELAGFTKTSDVEYVKRDPWELVVEAVKQMTAHNDVMRSDRLKQVMQEIDPNFDEKDAGFSRFSKFVIEAARRGLITLTRLDNGQYEIALGPQVAGAAASPGLTAMSEATEKPRSRRGGRGRGRGGSSREEQTVPTAAEPEQTEQTEEPEAPAAKAGAGFSFGGAFGLIKQAVGMGTDDEPAPQEEERQPSEETEVPRPVLSAPTPDIEDEDDIPMPTSSAPPPPYSTPSSTPGGIPMRSARFRRGSRGGARRPGGAGGGGAPEIPKIGVVEVDPNFRPRGDVLPPKAPIGQPGPTGPASGSGHERGERSERGGRGGRGARDRGPRGENGERGERGERGGRGRRGGRGGRGRGPRRFESESSETTNQMTRPQAQTPERSEPPTPPPPPPTVNKVPPHETEPGESFWSRVKRGLTGGSDKA
jgi:uncharacterized protein (TIGR00288 family)